MIKQLAWILKIYFRNLLFVQKYMCLRKGKQQEAAGKGHLCLSLWKVAIYKKIASSLGGLRGLRRGSVHTSVAQWENCKGPQVEPFCLDGTMERFV